MAPLNLTGVEFRDVLFARPLHLSGASIDRVTMAVVRVRSGQRHGTGASMLSVPWAWPGEPLLSWTAKDQAMRDATLAMAKAAEDVDAADPFEVHDAVAQTSAGLPMPALAATLALAAVDNAVHAALSAALRPIRHRLPVQHVVGVDDVASLPPDGIGHVKIKLAGRDPAADAARVCEVFAKAGRPRLSLDPNEGYADTAGVVELLERVRLNDREAFDAIGYVEQPVPRDAPDDPRGLRAVGRLKPVLIDEGLASADQLAGLPDQGWSGLVVKASKGSSLALRAHEFAWQRRLFVTIQDLTAVDLALEHSARLAAALPWSSPAFEYNSRQYCPAANDELRRVKPALVDVRDGHIEVD
ncbi:enolase C-terminal domain-like protein [Hamadaea sp. NPDC051192]|uniref:enolase C-terminal domain-like protein n=1 Tax=Hamadaea sp. NPDC051192 TaxID=3154940 RepID=UPI00341C8B82